MFVLFTIKLIAFCWLAAGSSIENQSPAAPPAPQPTPSNASSSAASILASKSDELRIMQALFDPDDEEAEEFRSRVNVLKQLPRAWNNADQLELIIQKMAALVVRQFCRTLDSDYDYEVNSIEYNFHRDVCDKTVLKKFVKYGRIPVLSEATLKGVEYLAVLGGQTPLPPEGESEVLTEYAKVATSNYFSCWKNMFLFGWDFLETQNGHNTAVDWSDGRLTSTTRRMGFDDAKQLLISLRRAQIKAYRAVRDAIPGYLGKHQSHLGDGWKAVALMLVLTASLCLMTAMGVIATREGDAAASVDLALGAYAVFLGAELTALQALFNN